MERRGPVIGVIAALGVLCAAGVVAFAVWSSGLLDAPVATPTSIAAARRATAPRTVGGTQPTPFRQDRAGAATPDAEPAAGDPVAVAAAVGPAVVTVINLERAGPFGGEAQESGRGTGFVIDGDGNIVTNNHVVAGGAAIQVLFSNGEVRSADLIGTDPLSDLAVVQVQGTLPAIARLGDSDLVEPGETVLAIGSPLGTFTNTVTRGIVSAIGRSVQAAIGQPELTGLIQHDAAISPGNSGGPLLNLRGDVVGVNTVGIPTGPAGPVQGIFFAIPANTVKRIAAALIETGEVAYPFFGIDYVPITGELAARNSLETAGGVFIRGVTADGPADRAGLAPGDVVVAIAGAPIDARHSFTEVLFAHQPGDTVPVTVHRNGAEIEVDVVLAERPG